MRMSRRGKLNRSEGVEEKARHAGIVGPCDMTLISLQDLSFST